MRKNTRRATDSPYPRRWSHCRQRLLPRFGILLAAVVLTSAPICAAARSLTSIDFPGARDTFAYGVSSNGDIVGGYTDTLNHVHAFLLHEGVLTPIDYPGAGFTVASGINARGDIVGYYLPPGAACLKDARGFLLRGGVLTSIDVPGAARTQALGINSQGDIVGFYDLPGDVCSVFPPARPFRGFILHAGVITDITVPGAFLTQAQGINPRGDIVGTFFTDSDNRYHGFLFHGGAFETIDPPGSTYTYAVSINARGDVLGFYSIPSHGFLLRRGSFSTFDVPGALGAFPYGLNARGDIVGVYSDAQQYFMHGFLLSAH